MFKVLCKVWRFILKILRMIVDGIAEVLGFILNAVVGLVGSLWNSLFDSGTGIGMFRIIGIGLLGLAAWWLYGFLTDDDKKEPDVSYHMVSAGASYE